MRIVSVRFFNLNSLRGEHAICFDRPPFTESGLFAITGPTGAGKTTILDAITVALYGRVHRHQRDVSEILSRHTAECYSEVEFEVKDKIYRARWSLRRSRGRADGALQPEKMELAEVATAKFIGGHTPTQIKQAIVDLCGLDYHQFLRSVILSQGDFTRFLKADDNERSELLEKITDTAVYSEVSRYVYERQKAEKEKLEQLNNKLDSAELLTEETRSAHEHHLAELAGEEQQLKARQAVIISTMNWLNRLSELQIRLSELEEELGAQQQAREDNRHDLERLRQHHLALTFRPALAEINTVRQRTGKLGQEQEQLQATLPLLVSAAEQAHLDLSNASVVSEKAQQELRDALPLLDKVIQTDSAIEGLQLQVARYLVAFEQAQAAVKGLISKEEAKGQELEQIRKDKDTLVSWLKEHEADGSLNNQLAVYKQYIRELRETVSALEHAEQEQSVLRKQEERDKALLLQLQQEEDRLKQQMADAEKEMLALSARQAAVLADRNVEDIEEEVAELPSLIGHCERQYKLSLDYRRLATEQDDLLASAIPLRESLATGLDDLQQLQQEKDAAEVHLRDLRQLAELQQRIQKYEADRQHLSDNEPCPLCGSLHHPYAETRPADHAGEAEKKRDAQEQQVNVLIKQLQEKNVAVNTLQLTIRSNEDQQARCAVEQQNILSEFNSINALLPAPLSIEKAETIIAVIRKKQQQLKELQTALRSLRGYEKQISLIQNTIADNKESLTRVQMEAGTIGERLKMAGGQFPKIEKQAAVLREKQATVFSALSETLIPFDMEFDLAHADRIERLLRERADRHLSAEKNLRLFELKHAQVQTELEKAGEALSEKLGQQLEREADWKHEADKLAALESERKALFGDLSPLTERERLNDTIKKRTEETDQARELLSRKQEELSVARSRIAQCHIELEDACRSLGALNTAFEQQLNRHDIRSEEDLLAKFLPDEDAQRIAQVEKELETRLATLSQLKEKTSDELQRETVRELTEETPEALLGQAEALDLRISSLNQEIGGINRILEEDSRLKVRFAEVTAQVEIQQKEYGRWLKLSALIGSADGRKFSRFAQGLTLARLTSLANHHLCRLNDRYLILKNPAKDLELQIIDRYQADVVRPMATLSGGESFLVSLALALGLSDLASRKVQINSLFIDEGFGTLDADTLDAAISALENLQARGKTIGIISHVEALKERIGTQVQVIKQPGGASRIRISGYAVGVGINGLL